jgi:hypothetical protein
MTRSIFTVSSHVISHHVTGADKEVIGGEVTVRSKKQVIANKGVI